MSEITLSLEHPSLGCGEIIARYDLSEIQEKAYKQGKVDGFQEALTDLGIVIYTNKLKADGARKFAERLKQITNKDVIVIDKQNLDDLLAEWQKGAENEP